MDYQKPQARQVRPPRWEERDLVALRTLPFLRGPDLPWSDWAMRPTAIAQLVEEMERGRRSAVELGSGVSTIVLARAARELGTRLVSFEHDRQWADEIRILLRREGLDAARVIDVALAPLDASTIRMPVEPTLRAPESWYDLAALGDALPTRIDLLIVDGPPAAEWPDVLIRAPAVPALEDRLAGACTVALDDASRRAERHTARLWAHRLGCELELSDTDLALLRRSGS
jgi:Methyltransferase domain